MSFKVNDEVTVFWGSKKKEYTVKIVKINDDGKTVKILWDEKTKDGNLLVSSKFLISKIKKDDEEEDDIPTGGLGLFDDPVDPDNVDDLIYQDKVGGCYKYEVDEIECPDDNNKIKEHPIDN